jgi:(2Fe-2S) ferredoxin
MRFGADGASEQAYNTGRFEIVVLDQSRPTVAMCRGCCCGTARKHPGFDHDAQVAVLRDLLQGVSNFRITDCLGPCERSNVLVVSPSKSGQRMGGRPTWLGFVLDEAAASDIAQWLCDGGPGLARLPGSLAPHYFDRPKKPRQQPD